jgi:hypothetical protein
MSYIKYISNIELKKLLNDANNNDRLEMTKFLDEKNREN